MKRGNSLSSHELKIHMLENIRSQLVALGYRVEVLQSSSEVDGTKSQLVIKIGDSIKLIQISEVGK